MSKYRDSLSASSRESVPWVYKQSKGEIALSYGEPTCALGYLLASAAYAKEKYGIKARLNTNGLANLYHKRNVVPELTKVVDSVSISLNAPTAEKYQKVIRPQFENAFPALLEFASLAQETFEYTQLSIVDVRD